MRRLLFAIWGVGGIVLLFLIATSILGRSTQAPVASFDIASSTQESLYASSTPLGPEVQELATTTAVVPQPIPITPKTTLAQPQTHTAPPQTQPRTLAQPVDAATLEAATQKLRQSLVNILCTSRSAGVIRALSGSGSIIDSRGVILTNAHVAQFFLLKDHPTPNNISCIIRTGSPAVAQYKARLLFLPPQWIKDNAEQITAQKPIGNGEHDYAFLLITERIDGSPLPEAFQKISLSLDILTPGEPAALAAYPAQFLESSALQQDLFISSSATTVKTLYTFGEENGPVDVLSVGGTILSQTGSSGGAVGRGKDGTLVALIATATAGSTTATRDLRAITLAHIDRSLALAGEGGLAQLLTGDLKEKADQFAENSAPTLTKLLVDALKR